MANENNLWVCGTVAAVCSETLVETANLPPSFLGRATAQIAARRRRETLRLPYHGTASAAFGCFGIQQLRFADRTALIVEAIDDNGPFDVANGQVERVTGM